MSFLVVLGVSVIRVSMAMWSEIPRAIDFGSLLQRFMNHLYNKWGGRSSKSWENHSDLSPGESRLQLQ